MEKRTGTAGIFVIMVSVLVCNKVWSAQLETLMMPGPVIDGHAEYEAECTQCHTRFSKKSQTRLCLDCHDEIATDIDKIAGYHGKVDEVRSVECQTCHTDHEGRDADIVQLNKEAFDHKDTDFALEGTHLKVSCTSCHKVEEPYSQAPGQCYSCHRQQDRHDGHLGEECGNCHQVKSWSEVQFDHDTTDFSLKGKHQEVACGSCHLNDRYDNAPDQCDSCHRLDDVHTGRNGTDCDSCHTPHSWDESRFDHDRKTDFPLKGKHKTIRCEACHTQSLKTQKLHTDCYSCHRHDDAHHGRHGKVCNDCHVSENWSEARFDHDSKTDFPLRGKHRDVGCVRCHRGDIQEENLDIACVSCHRADDVHKEQQGITCERCHSEVSWTYKVAFDHGLTRFPLLGMHVTTPCEECHLSNEYLNAATDCIACHQPDDMHEGTLGSQCQQCHTPNAWGLWLFDHNEQTNFALDGAHEELACKDCHTTVVGTSVRQSGSCDTCHHRDDVHGGNFGRNCGRCHSTGSFSDARLQ